MLNGMVQIPQSNKRTHDQSIKEEDKGELMQMHMQQNFLAGVQQPETFEKNNPNHMIDKDSKIWWCIDCDKKYKSYPAFYTHNKIKHNGNPPQKYRIPRALEDISKDRGRPRADNNPKMKFSQEDKAQHTLEDNLFDFLGNLGSKESSNTIIREYLKKPSSAFEVLEKNKQILTQRGSISSIYHIIEAEFKRLNVILKDHESDEFVDPLDIDPDTQDDVSLYNIKGLFNFMREKKYLNQFSILVIFLAWLGKELTEQALREVLLICIEYFSKFALLLEKKGPNAMTESRDAAKEDVKSLFEVYPFSSQLLLKFDDAKRLIDFFHQWFCNYDKMISHVIPLNQQQQQQQLPHFINHGQPLQAPQPNQLLIPHQLQFQQIPQFMHPNPQQQNLNQMRMMMDPNNQMKNQ